MIEMNTSDACEIKVEAFGGLSDFERVSAHTTAYEASGSSGTACELIKTRKIRFVRYVS